MSKSGYLENLKKCPLPSGWSLSFFEGKSPLLKTAAGLAFSLDFSQKKDLFQKQPLARALGFKGPPLSVLDITAGWGLEAFLISRLGCFVTAVEKTPFVFYFVQESLSRQGLSSPRLNFILDNSLTYLNNIKTEDRPDVIYMDPMFGDEKKSLSRKALIILKELAGEPKDQQALFEAALARAGQRLIVKRPQSAPPLQSGRMCFFAGRSVRYDVFRPKPGACF